MADNYLEKKYEDLQARKAKEQRLRQAAWKKRMDAYRKKMESEAGTGTGTGTGTGSGVMKGEREKE